MNKNIVSILTHYMNKVPFVAWDRFTSDIETTCAYGWINRPGSARKDFIVLQCDAPAEHISFVTSSAAKGKEITKLLFGDADGHVNCQRIETYFPQVTNAVHLKK